ncbi:glucosyltransferase domain-containing protein [Crocosphaera sp. Alani8]|uniref:glucosyltransferase domain-containing protein n=1 Tax=Crocosphaera sp. Alani8 TaxID=3038952 RepID=UPI00313ECE97
MINIIKLISLNKVEQKAFIYVFFVSILFLLSLIQANVLYVDDMYRVLSGYVYWNNDVRPLSTLIFKIIELGEPLTDISPLPQILSIALYSVSSIYLGKIFKVDNLIFLSLGGIAFVLSPFNLANFSFVFDSFTMGLAVFTSTTAFLITSIVLEQKLSYYRKIIIFFLILFLLVSSLCFYQGATSIYLAILTFYSLLNFIKDTNIQKSIYLFTTPLIILFISVIIYLPLKDLFVNPYASRRSQTPPFKDILNVFINNLFGLVKTVNSLLGNGNLSSFFYLLLILMMTTSILLFFYSFFKKEMSNIINFMSIINRVSSSKMV